MGPTLFQFPIWALCFADTTIQGIFFRESECKYKVKFFNDKRYRGFFLKNMLVVRRELKPETLARRNLQIRTDFHNLHD